MYHETEGINNFPMFIQSQSHASSACLSCAFFCHLNHMNVVSHAFHVSHVSFPRASSSFCCFHPPFCLLQSYWVMNQAHPPSLAQATLPCGYKEEYLGLPKGGVLCSNNSSQKYLKREPGLKTWKRERERGQCKLSLIL